MAFSLKSFASWALTLFLLAESFSVIYGYCGGFKKECDTCTDQRFESAAGLIKALPNIEERKDCATKCLKLADCMSFNYNTGTKACELNNAITNTLKTDAGWDYYKKIPSAPHDAPNTLTHLM